MTSSSKILKELTSYLSNLNNFHSLEVVDRVSGTQLQLSENSNWIIWRLKGWKRFGFIVRYQFWRLISRHYILPWSLDPFIRVPFQLHGEHTVLQPFRRIEPIVHIVISLTIIFTESTVAFEGEVPCPRTQHRNNVPRLRREKHDIYLKILYQAGFETALTL